MKKLFLLPFLVFGQFLVNAQKPVQRVQQVVTMTLLPAGAVHLPKLKGQDNVAPGKNKKETTQGLVSLPTDKNMTIDMQVVETVPAQNNTPASMKSLSVLYTITAF